MLQQTIQAARQTIKDALIASARNHFADYTGEWDVTDSLVTLSGSFINEPHVERGQFVVGRDAIASRWESVNWGEDRIAHYCAVKNGKPYVLTERRFFPCEGHAERFSATLTPVAEFDAANLL